MVAAGQKCKRCKADIAWLRTAKGAWMPVDASSVEKGDNTYDPKRHVPHWSTCPHAKEFKKKHPDKPEPPAPTPETYEQLEARLRAKGVIK